MTLLARLARLPFAVAMAMLFAFGALTPAFAQRSAESAAVRYGVQVERVVSPGGVEAWLVSDSTVPMIVVRAYWRGGAAVEPEALAGVTSVMADMLTEGAGERDANAFKERMEELNMSLSFGAGGDGVSMSLTTLSENRDPAFELARQALTAPR